jgi:hypothetical protein
MLLRHTWFTGNKHMPQAKKINTLPPLILHPFADANGPDKLVESSRASLMLQGLLPSGDRALDDLDKALLEGRYQEIRMLFYVGKDVTRWIEQCVEHVEREPELRTLGIRPQSFAAFLVNFAPAEVEVKLRRWGVGDYRAIFMRALGLNALLADMPSRRYLSDDFVRHYYRYADQLFLAKQGEAPFKDISTMGFGFELLASGEYSRRLEREWAEPATDSNQMRRERD